MISDEEFLLLYEKNNLRRTQNLNLWFQPENSRFEVRHAAKIGSLRYNDADDN